MKCSQVGLGDAFWFQEGPGVRKWQFTDKGIKLLNVANILKIGTIDLSKTDRHLSPEEVEKRYQHFLADAGDLVIASSGISIDEDGLLRTRGAFVEDQHLPLCMNTSTIRFKAIEGVSDLRFLRHWLQSREFRVQITREVTGIAQKNFGPSHLKRLRLGLPSLAEQIRIAGILDAADALRAKCRESLVQLDALVQSTFLTLFGDPIDNPMAWEVSLLDEVTNKITDGTHHSPPIAETGVPYITAKHLKKDGLRFFENPWYISPEHHAAIYSRCAPAKGDVLYIKDGATTGLAAINYYDFPFSTLSSLALLKVKSERLESQYLCAWLNNERNRSRLTGGMGGAAIKRLTLSKIKRFEIPLPPISLQRRFAVILGAVEKQKSLQRNRLIELDELFASLQRRAFNGELQAA